MRVEQDLPDPVAARVKHRVFVLGVRAMHGADGREAGDPVDLRRPAEWSDPTPLKGENVPPAWVGSKTKKNCY